MPSFTSWVGAVRGLWRSSGLKSWVSMKSRESNLTVQPRSVSLDYDSEAIAEVANEGSRPSGTQTLERGLDLLDRIVEKPVRMPELIAHSGLTKATVWRLVNTLINRNLVFLNDRGELQGGTNLLQLGARTQSHIDVLNTARPLVDELASRTEISAFLGQREGDDSVHLYRSAAMERVMVATPAGTRRRLAETSLGKALMLDDGPERWKRAFELTSMSEPVASSLEKMQEFVRSGVALNEGGSPDYINAIAAPIRNAAGTIVAATSVASPAQYLNAQQMNALSPVIAETAAKISAALGWSPK